MKRILITCLCVAASVSLVRAEGAISDAMKKFHKGETATCKKVAAGTASDAELVDILKSYQAMSGAKPPKGTASSWDEKCKALIAAVKQIQAKDAAGTGAFKKAVNCKACHEVHKGK
jgi:hypothetical protein